MTAMRKFMLRTALAVSLSVLALAAWNGARSTQAAQKAAQGQGSEIEHGKYLVEDVAMCSECHTPRDAEGNLKEDQWLQGAPVWITPVKPIANWAQSVPPLAGLPSLTDVQAERVLEMGVGPEGEVLRPPMHIYHMNPADAKAVIAYLKSLPRGNR
jgi:mono/diheme cytochrome c family protein